MAKQTKAIAPKHPGGRPPKIKGGLDEVFAKLQPFLKVGYSFHKACLFALVPYRTYIDYYNDDEEFRNKIQVEQNKVNIKARENLAAAVNDGDPKVSAFWLERQEKEDWAQRKEFKDVSESEVVKVLRAIAEQEDDDDKITDGGLLVKRAEDNPKPESAEDL